jgi:regulation of enolase protein 1 (concanavalin A-like superfamily)
MELTSRAITPAKENVTYTISYNPKTAHIRIFIDETMVREVHGFPTPSSSSSLPSTTPSEKEGEHKGQVFVGIMGCSPLGKGTDATFQALELREGVRDLV